MKQKEELQGLVDTVQQQKDLLSEYQEKTEQRLKQRISELKEKVEESKELKLQH